MKKEKISFLKGVKYNIIMAIVFTIMVIAPDYIYQAFIPNVHYLFDWLFILVITVFGFFLSMAGTWFFILCCILFMFMQTIQLGHIAYFLRPINPLDIGKVFKEFGDVYSASVADANHLWFVPLLSILPFILMILLKLKWRRKVFCSFIGILAVIVFLGVKPERATRRGLQHFLPPETRYSMHNSINSFSFYLVRGMDKENIKDIVPSDFYKEYNVTKLDTSSDLVVLVMGESTSADKMHLFNKEGNPTTPKLESYVGNPNFIYQEAISSGVSTHSSLPIFFNMMKEPGNVYKLGDYKTNLFKMAKENGYNTYFYSAYDMKQTNLIGVPFIDEVITSEKDRHKFKIYKEDLLVDLFKKIDLKKGKNFVVLNFKSVHSPYEENYSRYPQFDVFKPKDDSRFEEQNATYENAVLYIDDVLYRLIEYFKAQNIKNSQFIFTSDHAEMLGIPDGKYGHNQLLMESMRVPFILYSNNGILPTLPNGMISHYEISLLVAEYLGYRIENPNYDNDTFFVHGNNLFEEYEFVQFKRTKEGNLKKILKDTVKGFVASRDNNE